MLALRTPLSFAVKTLMFGSLATLSTVAFSASDSTDLSNEDVPTTTLDTITVTASSGGVTPTVNQQIIEKSTILDMKDVLKDQPSLSVSGGNGVAQQLYIRNMGENELTFSVDNVSTSAQVFHHQSRFMFDPALLKSINIEKGTGAASSGIGVTAGAIRMTTVNANDMLKSGKDVGAMIGGGYSSNEGWNGVTAAYGRSSNGAVDGIIMGNIVHNDNYEDGDGNEVPYTEIDQEGYLAKLGWNINPDNRLELSHRREQMSGDIGFRPNLIGTFGDQTIFDTETTQDTTNLAYQGYDIGGIYALDIDANVFYSKTDDERKQIDNLSARIPDPLNSEAETTGANLSVTYPVTDAHRLVTGINYRDSKISADAYTVGTGEEEKEEYGVFAEMRWDFDPILLTTGVRYDHYDITNNTEQNLSDGMVSPSIAATWFVNNNLSLNASWSQAIQSPKLYESLILALANGDRHSFADDLEAGKAQNAEIGIEWMGDNGFMAGASVFDQRFKDYINTYDTVQANQGELKNQGYELNLGYQNNGIKAYLGMSHNDPELNGEYYGYALDVVPTGDKYVASVSYQFDDPQLEIGVKHRHMDEYQYREASETEDRTMPKYWVTDVFANWQPFNNDSLSLNAGINNIADKMYYNQSNFRSTRFTDLTNWNAERGREYRVGINYKF